MKKYTIFIAISISMFLFANISYGKDLTEKEWKIYYSYKEAGRAIAESPVTSISTSVDDVNEKYNLTNNEMEDLISRGESQKLTKKQRKIYDDLSKKQKKIEKAYQPRYKKTNADLASEYGITKKELERISGTAMYYTYDMTPEEELTAEDKKDYAENKKVFTEYRKRKDSLDAEKESEIRAMQQKIADKHNIPIGEVIDILEKGRS